MFGNAVILPAVVWFKRMGLAQRAGASPDGFRNDQLVSDLIAHEHAPRLAGKVNVSLRSTSCQYAVGEKSLFYRHLHAACFGSGSTLQVGAVRCPLATKDSVATWDSALADETASTTTLKASRDSSCKSNEPPVKVLSPQPAG
jgi:hypothetical protein